MWKRAPLEKRLRLRGKVWFFWGYDWAGVRYEVTTRQTDRKLAIEAAKRIELERKREPLSETDQAAQVARSTTLLEALNLLAAHDKRVGAAKKTIDFHYSRGRHLIRIFGKDRLLSEFHANGLAMVQQYSDQRLSENAHRHTIQKEHRVLRHALKLAAEIGLYAGDPKALKVEGFSRAKGKRGYYQPGRTWLERPEYVDALLRNTSTNSAKHRIDRVDDILCYVNLGVRRRELLVIKPEHVDLDEGTVWVRGTKTDGAERHLPINERMRGVFARRLREARHGQPLFVDWGSGNRDLRANWGRARAELLAAAESDRERERLDATLPRSLTFNDLRRTFCSQLKNAGVSFEDCAALLGHEDIAMVRTVYGMTAMDGLKRAVARLPEFTVPERPKREAKPKRKRKSARAHISKFVAQTVASNLPQNANRPETLQ